jgi:hypothetical protein
MTVLVVALALADHADHDGFVHIAIGTVAEQARVARSTAWEAVHALERLGEVERVRHGGKRGPGDANIYRLTVVDNLSKRGPVAGPLDGSERGPKGVRKGSGLSDTIRSDVDTYKANDADEVKPRPRRTGSELPARDDPDVVPPDGVGAQVADLRSRLRGPS